jgi:hypothetical protein
LKLLEGLQGLAAAMTRAEWDSIRQEALERFGREQGGSFVCLAASLQVEYIG